MQNYGLIRVAAAVPRVWLADIRKNTSEVCRMTEEAEKSGVSLLCFPELNLTGYTCADLFGQDLLISEAENAVAEIRDFTRGKEVTVVVGAPVRYRSRLYNCAVIIRNGQVKGLVPKIYLPTYSEFYESRWFSSGADFLSKDNIAYSQHLDNAKDYVTEGFDAVIRYAGMRTNINPCQIFTLGHATFAVEVCEDLWTPIAPSSYHAMAGAQIILNLSASNETIAKQEYRRTLVGSQSARTISGYVYCSCGYGESTQDLVFAGSSMIYENGTLMCENERFQMESSMIIADIDVQKLQTLRQKQSTFNSVAPDGTRASQLCSHYLTLDLGPAAGTDFGKSLYRHVDPHPFVPSGKPDEMERRAREITSIQVTGLMSRLGYINCRTAVVGVSGGLDSTLALLVICQAFDRLGWDRKRIIGVTMPGFGTTGRTYQNSIDLMNALGITSREVSIVPAVRQHFKDVGQDPDLHDVTYENCQARERTQILMDIAGREGGIVVGTGDLSELALGWATYNGDHMSMYGVNASIPKTLVRHLIRWAAQNRFSSESQSGRSTEEILLDIIDTPVSPELTPADENGNIKQVTEDIIGPYELHDFFLYNMMRFGYSPEKLLFMACKAFEGTYDRDTIHKWLKTFTWKFFSQQFKRSCLPDGPKVGSVSLSPRGDWRMPSDAYNTLFSENLNKSSNEQ